MYLENKKILVTGGAGFIGSHLVDKLAERNYVTILDDFSVGAEVNLQDALTTGNVEIIKGDVRDSKVVEDATTGKEVVFHLAVECLRSSLQDPIKNGEVNATGTLILSNLAQKHNVRRFVYISSSEVYGTALNDKVLMSEEHPCKPTTVYGASKLAGELYARAIHNLYGMPTIIIRPFNTYGPRENFRGIRGEVIPRFTNFVLSNKPPVIFGDGTQTRDFTYVDDIVDGIVKAAENDSMIGEIVNLAFGKEVSILQIANIIINKLDKQNKIIPEHIDSRPGDVMRHNADISKARGMLRFEPKISIELGISMYLDWIRSQNLAEYNTPNNLTVKNW